MGTPILPDEYGDDCSACFPAGKTPKYIYLFVSGILKGNNWEVWMPEPAFGKFTLTQTQPCMWVYTSALWQIGYQAINGGSYLLLNDMMPTSHFVGDDPANCIYWFENQFQTPIGTDYYNGQAQLFFTPQDAPASIASLMALLNIDRLESTRCEAWPTTDGYRVARIANAQHADNILIKTENTS